MPLGCQWSSILSTLMMSLLPWTTSCLISLGLLSNGVLILGSPLLSSLRFIILSLGLFVILFGLSLICTPFLWSVVHFCMPLLLMLLLAFLIFLFVLWLRCIGVVLQLMLCSSPFLFMILCEIKKLFLFYFYFPHMRLCVCWVFQEIYKLI